MRMTIVAVAAAGAAVGASVLSAEARDVLTLALLAGIYTALLFVVDRR